MIKRRSVRPYRGSSTPASGFTRSFSKIPAHAKIANGPRLTPIASAIAAALFGDVALATSAEADSGKLEEIVVTAEKRSENLQSVPISIQALSSTELQQLGVKSFDDYAQLVPSMSFTTTGPGAAQIYIRGLSDGSVNFASQSGTQPSVAVYLDEQPVTTIGRAVDVEMYDIARLEVLEGPQGTLFGSSSEAGTVRIITNAPNPAATEFGADFGYAFTQHGDPSTLVEGFGNIPLGDSAALRIVAWNDSSGGYIDNVHRTFTFTFPGAVGYTVANPPVVDNALYVKDHFNDSGKSGLRLALRVLPAEHWTVDAKFMTQTLTSNGVFDVDPALGDSDLAVARYFNDSVDDVFRQSSVTVNGKFDGFDLTYAGSYLDRNILYEHDYSMYSNYSAFVAPYYVCEAAGTTLTNCGDPREQAVMHYYYSRWDHELRLQTPLTVPVHALVGAFYESLKNRYGENWDIPGLPPSLSVVPNNPYTYFNVQETRRDRQEALFGEVTWDIGPRWSITGGTRWFDERDEIDGFIRTAFVNQPSNLGATQVGDIQKGNVSFKIDPSKLLYATFSEGYRPNGVNRGAAPGIPQYYLSDTVKNYEVGFKSQWLDNRLRLNLTAYRMKWDRIQLTTLVPGTIFFVTTNAGKATNDGAELQLQYRPVSNLTLSLNGAYIKTRLTQNYCLGVACPNPYTLSAPGAALNAPSGSELPFVPKDKVSAIARYEFPLSTTVTGYAQVNATYTGDSYDTLFLETRTVQPSYTLANLKLGSSWDKWNAEVAVDNLADKRAVLFINRTDYDFYQGSPGRYAIARPRTLWLTMSYRM